MLICQKCGVDNPLGRVFCGSCGAKLDLTHMTQAAVSEAVRVPWFVLHWRKFATGLACLAAALVVLALIPATEAIGEAGTLGGGRRVESLLRKLSQLEAGRPVSASFDEKDINGYFEFIKSRNLEDYDRVSVDVRMGYFLIRLEKTLFELTALGLDWQPKMSYELTCVPAGAGGVAVRKARMRRLALVGPFRTRLVRRLRGRMAQEKDWNGLRYLTQVDMKDDAIHVGARR